MKFGAMKAHRRNRLLLVLFLVAAVGGATAFALLALNENINLFYAPEQIANGEAPLDTMIRAGGMVQEGSVLRDDKSLKVSFVDDDDNIARCSWRDSGNRRCRVECGETGIVISAVPAK